MCNFKSGVILRNKIVLAPDGNESHSNLLESLRIKDNYDNASRVFVRVELIPKHGNKATDVDEWLYKVDQDILPHWYELDPKRYEEDFRVAVKEYMKEQKMDIICGYAWTPIKDGNYTYYVMNGVLKKSEFGKTNNYAESFVRNNLINSELALDLKKKFGDKLLPISLDLTSMDGFKDYGTIEDDILAIPNIQLLMRFGEKIPLIDVPYWLATPNQTPARKDSSYVRFVCSGGGVFSDGCGWGARGVRPFFISQS